MQSNNIKQLAIPRFPHGGKLGKVVGVLLLCANGSTLALDSNTPELEVQHEHI